MIERLTEIVSLPSWEIALICIVFFICGSFQEWLFGTRPLETRGEKNE